MGLTWGKVISNSCSLTITETGVTFSDIVKTDYLIDDGDSGGLVYTDIDGQYYILGNHKAKGSGYSYVVKASNIMSRLSVNPY